MFQLEAAMNIAIGLGGSITFLGRGFIACFDSDEVAVAYLQVLNRFPGLRTRSDENCVVVTVA